MKIRKKCGALVITMLVTLLPQAMLAEGSSFMETSRLDFDEDNVFNERVNGFKWKITGTYPTAVDGMGIFDKGEAKSDCLVTLPTDYTYDGVVRVEMRVKNDVDDSSDAKNAAIYFRNGSAEIMRAQIKADGYMYFQGGTETGYDRLDIKSVNTVTDEFYTYTFDFDFDEHKISASVKNDSGDELATDECTGFNFYKNNNISEMDSILISKSSSDGKLYMDYLSVSKMMSDESIAQTVLEKTNIKSAEFLTEDFTLPKKGAGDSEITWESKNPNIEIEDSGDYYTAKVTIPETGNVSGAIKCTVTKGDIVVSKEIETTVLHKLSNKEKAERDLDEITVDCDYVTGDVELPKKGTVNGSNISWSVEQSKYAVISDDGYSVIVTRPDSSEESKNVRLTAKAELDGSVATRDFSLRIIKSAKLIVDEKYSEVGFVKNANNGYGSVRTSGLGYPAIEYDEVLGEDCLVFGSDISKSEAIRTVPEYSAQEISIKAKFRVDSNVSGNSLFYIYDANLLNILRVAVTNNSMVVNHGSGDGSSTAKTTVVESISTSKYYTVELIFNYSEYTVSVVVDGVKVAEELAFMPTASKPDVPTKVLFGTGAGLAAKMMVESLCIAVSSPELNDREACAADAEKLTDAISETISADFEVPTKGENDTEISWSSSDETVLGFADGKATVHRPDSLQGDKEITVTAVVTRGVTSHSVTYKTTILSVSDSEAVDAALDACTLGDLSAVKSDIELPESGLFGVRFSWKSSDTSIVSDSGAVNRSRISSDKNVTLTLTGTKNNTSKEKRFNVTVKAGSNGGGGGGGGSTGGGYSSSGLGASISTPSATTSVPVKPQPTVQPQKTGFKDLAGYGWASESILSLYERGYITGKSEGIFDPGANVLREEFVTVLVKTFGLYDETAECDFSDLPESHWSYRYVASAVKTGAVNGMGDGTFGTGSKITRQDMCVMLLRAMNSIGYTVKAETKTEFSDCADIAGYAIKAVEKLAAAGVVNGMDDENFGPLENANRAQMAKVIYLAEKAKIAGTDDLSVPEEPTESADKENNTSDKGGQQSRLPYTGADETALRMYNTVSDRKEKAMKLYYDSPSVALNTGAWSDVGYGMAALWQNDVDAGNECVIRVCTDHPPMGGTQSSDSYFGMNLLMRMWYTFSDKSDIYPGRLSKEAQDAIEKYFYDYISYNADLETAYNMPGDSLFIQDSENHDIVQRAAFLIGSEILLESDTYRDKSIGGISLEEYNAAWNKYFRYYFDCKARYGLTIETGSPTYSKYTSDSMYTIYDFAGDKELKEIVGKYLDVYYADAVMETLNGVRGGAKNRNYQDKYSFIPNMDSINFLMYLQFGTADYMYHSTSMHPAQISAAATDYVAPFELFDIMYNKTNDGGYAYESQTMGEGSRTTIGPYNALYYKLEFPGNVYKKTYITDDYVMSTQLTDRNLTYAQINTQNRWMGVTFKGGMHESIFDSRVFVQGIGTAQNGRTGYNEISGICENGAMIISGLTESENSTGTRIYVSSDIFSTKRMDNDWLIAEDPDGNCFVAIKAANGGFQSITETRGGYYVEPTEAYVPIVIQVAAKSEYKDLEAFAEAVKAAPFKWSGTTLNYTSLNGDVFEVSNGTGMPKINSEELTTLPEYLVCSPYFNSVYGSGIFKIVDTNGHEFIVDFN